MSTPAATPRKSRVLAWIALLLLPAGPLLARTGLLPAAIAFLLSMAGVLLGLIALLVTVVMLLRPSLRAQRGAIATSAAIAAVPFAIGLGMAAPGIGRPAIHDITTDLADPPQFTAAVQRRGADSNPLARGAETDAQQRAGYPDLGGIASPLAPDAALSRAAEVAKSLGWEVYALDAASGTLEASETTQWFGFTDDVVVRVRPDPAGGSRLDLRSVSRVGQGDLGANARRIERFHAAFAGAP